MFKESSSSYLLLHQLTCNRSEAALGSRLFRVHQLISPSLSHFLIRDHFLTWSHPCLQHALHFTAFSALLFTGCTDRRPQTLSLCVLRTSKHQQRWEHATKSSQGLMRAISFVRCMSRCARGADHLRRHADPSSRCLARCVSCRRFRAHTR